VDQFWRTTLALDHAHEILGCAGALDVALIVNGAQVGPHGHQTDCR
jgi:hypothetical protein